MAEADGGARGDERPDACLSAWQEWEDAITALAVLAAVLGHVALLVAGFADLSRPIWRPLAAPAMTLAAGALTLLARRQPYHRRAVAFASLLFAASLMFDAASSLPYVQYLYALCAFVAGSLLGPRGAVLIALCGTAAAVTFGASVIEAAALPYTLGALWLSAAVSSAAYRASLAALQIADAQVAIAWNRVRAAESRRGELVGAKKTLDSMYALLERTNYELSVTREEAEEARRAKAHFAATVSHELRTPLNLIAGFTELMYRFPETYGFDRWPPQLSADIHEVYQSSRHILGMIDDVLDLSRVEANRMPLRIEPTDTTELIFDVVDAAKGLFRGRNVALRTDVPRQLPELLLDRQRISQVLLNLISNASRFTHEGHVLVSAEECDGEVAIRVSDTGVGMSEEDLGRVFDEFSQGVAQAGAGSSGLGLAICRQLVHLHGGRIDVQSRLGEGSTFCFTIPVPHSGRARSRLSYYAPEDWRTPLPAQLPQETAIVVAPDEATAAPVSRALPGYRSVIACTAEEIAARTESEHPAGVVLLEREGEPGPLSPEAIWQACGQQGMPIIRYQLPTTDAARTSLGVCAYLEKPVGRDRLLAALHGLCPPPRRVLVADDDAGFAALVRRIIESEFADAAVSVAHTGAEVLTKLREHAVDTIVLDIVMPGGGGLEVVERLREDARLAGARVIVATGSGYAAQIAASRPLRLELLRPRTEHGDLFGVYAGALLRACPPDYSRRRETESHSAAAPARPAS